VPSNRRPATLSIHGQGSTYTRRVQTRSAESARRTRVRRVTFDELGTPTPERLEALGPAPCAELLHVLMLPDFDRVDRTARRTGSSGRCSSACCGSASNDRPDPLPTGRRIGEYLRREVRTVP
jgi:hypothetical protein